MQFPRPDLNLSKARYLNVQSVRDEELDAVFQQKIGQLRAEQEKHRDDYEMTRVILNTIERVRHYGVKALQLNELKQVAVDNEDYQTAKKLKIEVDGIKKTVSELDPSRGFSHKSLGTAELRDNIAERQAKLYQMTGGIAGSGPVDRKMI